jgi:hypothetical protein
MLDTVEGRFRDGRVELLEAPPSQEEARVIVTFLPPDGREIMPASPLTSDEAADLRVRLRSFAEDWDRPDMDVYDTL